MRRLRVPHPSPDLPGPAKQVDGGGEEGGGCPWRGRGGLEEGPQRSLGPGSLLGPPSSFWRMGVLHLPGASDPAPVWPQTHPQPLPARPQKTNSEGPAGGTYCFKCIRVWACFTHIAAELLRSPLCR